MQPTAVLDLSWHAECRKDQTGTNFLYVAAGLNGLQIYNIEDVKNPVLASVIQLSPVKA
jgi:hypothetical protein